MISNFAIVMFILASFIFFCFFCHALHRFSVTLNDKTIRHAGHLLYRMMCKSGFMVILVIIITYVICTNEINHETKSSSDQYNGGSLNINTKPVELKSEK